MFAFKPGVLIVTSQESEKAAAGKGPVGVRFSVMMCDDVDAYALSLPGCKRKGSLAHPAWYVRDRLVARLVDPTTLLVRVPMDRREALIDRFPGSFGTPPRYEAHHKVEAYLERADDAAVTEAIRLAWEFQQSW